MYRSCRKLSVLPEEENDEALNRIPSFKNSINPKTYSAKFSPTFKTQSADDVTNIGKRNHNKPFGKQVSSCVDIVLTSHLNSIDPPVESRISFHDSPILTSKFNNESPICDNTASDDDNDKAEEKSVNNSNELQLPILDPVDALRQPHSFDSYLDPQQIQSSSLARQISDPTQNTGFAPPITRRGSYIKRPRSTCRPLRLPCDENGKRKEERVYKVRFDLSSNANANSKPVDNINGNKGPILASSLKNNENNKTRYVSRFKVEVVDEDEFRKSLEESSKFGNRKRPPLIHSVVYKKSVLHDLTPFQTSTVVKNDEEPLESPRSKPPGIGESPDSPSYETATENSPMDSLDAGSYESNYLIADIYPCKRRKQSDSSGYSGESQDSMEGNDIFIKSIKLHANSECIVMKDLGKESPPSQQSLEKESLPYLSLDNDIPFIDAEDLPVVKPSPEISKTTQTDVSCFVDTISTSSSNLELSSPVERKLSDESCISTSPATSPTSPSDSSSGTFLTPCGDITPSSDVSDISLAPPKSSSLSKSPTVLKNLANFEVFSTVSESVSPVLGKRISHCVQSEILEEDEEKEFEDERNVEDNEKTIVPNLHTILKRNSSDISETSDTVTYVTVKSDPSNLLLSSDCDSDTYVTIRSDRSSLLERKFSDLSENSSSPYNTPPSTSSASFCTPPDTYSPILNRLSRHLAPSNSSENDSPKSLTRSSSPFRNSDLSRNECSGYTTNTSSLNYDTPPNLSPFSSPPSSSPYRHKINCYSPLRDSLSENESVTIYNIEDSNFPVEKDETTVRKELIIFDSPKLEFYETNDSVENLEAFLKKEEGLQEPSPKESPSDESPVLEKSFSETQQGMRGRCSFDSLGDSKYFEMEEGKILAKHNSLDSPSGVGEFKLFEKRSKRHPPLSRQNSTEEYNFLEPHDSCLNLSEEISSPSTTPDTSNKTVIFKNKPLTVSNTIDLDDDDFPISESEIHINFNGSQTEILEIPMKSETFEPNTSYDIYSCRSEPCIPSISSSADLPELSRLCKQSCSVTDDSYDIPYTKSETNLPIPPEIIVSNLSSESEKDSDSEAHVGGILIDFASNASDRSEIHLSDLNSLSGQSDNVNSNSDQSENNVISDRSSELPVDDSDRSHSISPEVSDGSSPHDKVEPTSDQFNTSKSDIPDPSKSNYPIPPLETSTDPTETHFIDIPEHLSTSDVGNLTVIDLPSCSSGNDTDNTQEASFSISNLHANAYCLNCAFLFFLIFYGFVSFVLNYARCA